MRKGPAFRRRPVSSDPGRGRSLQPTVRRTRRGAASYLRQGGAQLALQRVAVVHDVLQVLLGQAQALLRLPQRVQQPVPLVQHVDHQLLEMGVRVRGAALGAALAQRRVLADGGHHLAHHLGAAEQKGFGVTGGQNPEPKPKSLNTGKSPVQVFQHELRTIPTLGAKIEPQTTTLVSRTSGLGSPSLRGRPGRAEPAQVGFHN